MQDLGGDVLALMDLLGIERASYCGVSIGGMVGMWLAINAPERVNRLVLVCTSAHLPPASSWAERSTTVRAAGTTEVIADMILGRWLTAPFAAAHPDVAGTLRAMLVSIEPEGYAAACSAIERMDLRDELAHVAAPTLVVSATHDTATPPDHGREIAMLVPGARFELVPGAHLANVECAREVSKFVLDHLREEA